MSTTSTALLSRSPEQTSPAAAPASSGVVRVTLTEETQRKLNLKAASSGEKASDLVYRTLLKSGAPMPEVKGSSNVVVVFPTIAGVWLAAAMESMSVDTPLELIEALLAPELADIPDTDSEAPAFI